MKKQLILMSMATVLLAAPALANEGDMKAKAEHYMMKIDANNDGVITKGEHATFSNNMFDQADANDDNQISKEEFIAFKEAEMAEHKAMKKQ